MVVLDIRIFSVTDFVANSRNLSASAGRQSLRSMRRIRCNVMNLEGFQQMRCCYQPKEVARGGDVKVDKILLSALKCGGQGRS